MKTPLVFSIGPKGDRIARHIAQLLGSPVHLCGTGRDDAAPLVKKAYAERAPIVGVCAAGILIRLLGTDLGDKVSEPPVLAVSADGKIAVPLLGSHRGANALARWVAEGFRGTAAVTSFSDTLYDFSLDDPPPGYAVGNPEAVRPLMAALLKGEKLNVEGPSGWLSLAGYPVDPEGSLLLRVTERAAAGPGLLVHPKTLVVGLGCTSRAESAEVIELIEQVLGSEGLSPHALAAFATIESHGDAEALRAAALHFDVPLRVFTKREIGREKARLHSPSDAVEEAIGVPGVCEAVALKAGALLVPKRKSEHVTCAVGRADMPVDPRQFGKGV
ncbi:cobalamin biosynthesis protein [Pelagibacterium halotolerans]|uniref:cobalamin biosynthesis protein n=1 Tax=Pelagibacterium halotolerans TaxID=531813 RepID=UPI00384A6185